MPTPVVISGMRGPIGQPGLTVGPTGSTGPTGGAFIDFPVGIEEPTGQSWVDGRPIYQTTVLFPRLPAQPWAWRADPHGIVNMAMLVAAWGVVFHGHFLPYLDATEANWGGSHSSINFFVTPHEIMWLNGNQDRSSGAPWITFRYTCTDR